jgi:hypothetical protein
MLPMKYECPICNHVFTQKSNYEMHIKRKRPCHAIDTDIVANRFTQFEQELERMNKEQVDLKDVIVKLQERCDILEHTRGEVATKPVSAPVTNTTCNINVRNMSTGFVYLIQPEELLGTNRYKVGCSKKPNMDRLKDYKRNSHLLCSYKCADPFETEEHLKAAFGAKFARVAGNEYFQGNEADLLQEFFNVVLNAKTSEVTPTDDKVSKEASQKTMMYYGLGRSFKVTT